MDYKVKILPTAWEDSKRIEDRYAVQFDADTALKVSDHLLDAISRLEHIPDSGSLLPDEWLNRQGFRMLVYKKHAAIYRQIDQAVYVYHIADVRTEYTKLFE
ncbi:MAG: type II toxin-antitoxin system RelE/ParE family toxin [Lachnospiraceae bacterium]|nr:type II toxin-antitoxin system RelE/ParE family toxin [Lachnospiraceae bacterium]